MVVGGVVAVLVAAVVFVSISHLRTGGAGTDSVLTVTALPDRVGVGDDGQREGPSVNPAIAAGAPTTQEVLSSAPLPPAPAARRVPLPSEPLAPVFSRLPISDKVVFLGIDDGNVRDPRALDYLAQAHLPFTIFLTMGPARQDPRSGSGRRPAAGSSSPTRSPIPT
jgi:hypothetical protein